MTEPREDLASVAASSNSTSVPSRAVLITGCSSGIRHATALHLVRED